MRVLLHVKGMSQYSNEIEPQLRNSACGPTTVFVILNYLYNDQQLSDDVNKLYKLLGGTKMGLFKWRLIKNLQNYLGRKWKVEECSLKGALQQLDKGFPVAMKFDKHFTGQWRAKPTFKYHWVPLIGYEIKDNELYLIVHDNGGRNRESQIRTVRYAGNDKVLSFVKIEPK